jgi:hypothetical protein
MFSGFAENAKLTTSVKDDRIRKNLLINKNHIPKRIIGNRKI